LITRLRIRFAVAASGLGTEQVGVVTVGESFGSLIAQLPRTEGDGFDPQSALRLCGAQL